MAYVLVMRFGACVPLACPAEKRHRLQTTVSLKGYKSNKSCRQTRISPWTTAVNLPLSAATSTSVCKFVQWETRGEKSNPVERFENQRYTPLEVRYLRCLRRTEHVPRVVSHMSGNRGSLSWQPLSVCSQRRIVYGTAQICSLHISRAYAPADVTPAKPSNVLHGKGGVNRGGSECRVEPHCRNRSSRYSLVQME